MTQKPNQEERTALEEAEIQFEKWRKNRNRGARIPQNLWDLAAVAAQEHGISKVAGSLALSYYKLKELLASTTEPIAAPGSKSPSEKAETKARFRQLFFPPLPAPAPECVLELADGEGKILRAVLKAASAEQVASLARTFWSLTP
jgi:hypothetical protein